VIELLLNKGADIHAKTSYSQTALHCAHGQEVLQLLLDKGADARSLDIWRNTAKYLAQCERQTGDEGFLKLWLENNPNLT
jgi:hypothetical protein